MKPRYIELLTMEERAGAMKLGATLKLAECGIHPSRVKEAAIAVSPGGMAKTMITVSLLAGVPLGVVAHAIGRHVTQQNTKDKELQEKIRFYRDATNTLETGLAAPTGPTPRSL